MRFLERISAILFPDKRSDWEKKQERQFIKAANGLKSLSVTERGGMSIDPEEIRDQVLAGREQLKHLVRKPQTLKAPAMAPSVPVAPPFDDHQLTQNADDHLDCSEVVTWRRLPSGAAVRYVSVKLLGREKYAVVAADLFPEGGSGLPPWLETQINQRVAATLKDSGLKWFDTVREAMDAFDKDV